MKFLKKLALDISVSSNITSPVLFLVSTHLESFLSICLRSVENLANHLHTIAANNGWRNHMFSNRKFSYPDKKNFETELIRSRKKASVDWIPLIKATAHMGNCADDIHKSIDNYNLGGRFVLCIGGRGMLYPAYRQLVEAARGNFLAFHGDSSDNIDELHALLECADMIICPVDCVNHEAYFAVKHYCRDSGKPCALLDRSRLATFRKGIEVLITITNNTVNN